MISDDDLVVTDEDRLKDKLRAIEALFSGATTEGERDAAGLARERILDRIASVVGQRPIEWQFTVNPWSRQLLLALSRRYGIKPYRYRRQRYTSLVIKAPESFLLEVFLPEYDRMVEVLNAHLTAVTTRIVAEVLSSDLSEPEEVAPLQLNAFSTTNR